MSDSKKSHEMDEARLEQVAGGSDREIVWFLYYCPNCGREEDVPFFKDSEYIPPMCTECDMQGRGRFKMIRK